MSEKLWTDVDNYLNALLVGSDAALESALEASKAGGLPSINVAPNQGKFLHLLARLMNARAILEIGTLGGYSSIWMARALPPFGRLITLEFSPKHAEVARNNIAHAGLSKIVDVRVGAALDTLPIIEKENAGPFDMVFIDADKVNIPHYFTWALKLTRRGGLIVVDNVVRDGKVIDANSADENVQGVRKLNEMISAEPRVSATALQTVGVKGYDGLTLALVVG